MSVQHWIDVDVDADVYVDFDVDADSGVDADFDVDIDVDVRVDIEWERYWRSDQFFGGDHTWEEFLQWHTEGNLNISLSEKCFSWRGRKRTKGNGTIYNREVSQ